LTATHDTSTHDAIDPSSPTEPDSGEPYGDDDDDPYADLNRDSSPIPLSDLDEIEGNVSQPRISHAIESFNKIHCTSVSHLDFQQQGLVYLHQISSLRADYCVERMMMRRRVAERFLRYLSVLEDEYAAAVRSAYRSRSHDRE
jgi:hypothetical protein